MPRHDDCVACVSCGFDTMFPVIIHGEAYCESCAVMLEAQKELDFEPEDEDAPKGEEKKDGNADLYPDA